MIQNLIVSAGGRKRHADVAEAGRLRADEHAASTVVSESNKERLVRVDRYDLIEATGRRQPDRAVGHVDGSADPRGATAKCDGSGVDQGAVVPTGRIDDVVAGTQRGDTSVADQVTVSGSDEAVCRRNRALIPVTPLPNVTAPASNVAPLSQLELATT